MNEIEYISIAVLSIFAITALHRTARIADAIHRRDLITEDIAGCCESLGFVGCSVICSGVYSLKHIEELLGQEYDRYEVIITLDAKEQSAAFQEIIERYRMIRVNCSSNEELPTATIRALYRSRQRSFRRLILVDKVFTEYYDDLDAATAIASYNYLLPVGHNSRLCPKAVECIAITLSEQETQSLDMLYSLSSEGVVFRRDAVIANGGFSQHIVKQIPSKRQIYTYIPLIFSNKLTPSPLPTISVVAATICTIQLLAGARVAIATMMTIIMIIALARYLSKLSTPTNCSLRLMLCYFRKITSIFRLRKFRIS